VRRNFLSSFLLAFDTPAPFSTVGKRTVSNVPAQALILMNDPFVHNQADVWAKRVVAERRWTMRRACAACTSMPSPGRRAKPSCVRARRIWGWLRINAAGPIWRMC
jgi:Protein of unknown function (DUF1553)